jgi:hypothetical protein
MGKSSKNLDKDGLGLSPGLKTLGSSTSTKAPMKTGQVDVRTPKSKMMPDAFGKKSLFFKSEDFGQIKRPSVEKLRSFLEKNRSKRK